VNLPNPTGTGSPKANSRHVTIFYSDKDLQKFVLKYASTEGAFGKPSDMKKTEINGNGK